MKRLRQNTVIAAVLLVLSPLLGIAAAANPFGIWFAAVFSATAAGIALSVLPYYMVFVPAVISVAGGYIMYGPYGAAIAFAAVVPGGFSIGYCIKKKKSFNFCVSLFAVSVIYFLSALLTVYIYRRGGGLDYAALQRVMQPLSLRINSIIDNALKLLRTVMTEAPSELNIDAEILKKTVSEQFIYVVPGYIISFVFIAAFAAAQLTRKVLPVFTGKSPENWGDFVSFHIARPIAFLYVLFIIVVTIERLSGNIDDNITYHALSNLITVLNLFFFTAGISTLYRFFARKQSYFIVRYLILAAIILLSVVIQSGCTMAVVFIGLYDTLFSIRNIPKKKL